MALSKGFTQSGAVTPLDARLMEAAKVVHHLDGTVRTGILSNPQVTGNIAFSRSTMAVGVPDQSTFVVSRVNTDGVAILTNVGAIDVVVPAAPASNSRYDVLYVKQDDSTQGDADSLPVFGILSGTAAASPAVPALTSIPGAYQLATILVPSGVTATNAAGVVITSTGRFTALQGGPVRYRALSSMLAEASLLPEGTTGYVQNAAASAGLFVIRGGVWTRLDGDSFSVVQQSGTATTGSTAQVLSANGSGTISPYASDSVYFPTRADAAISVGVAGWYEVIVSIAWAANATGERYVSVTQNAADFTPPVQDRRPAIATASTTTPQTATASVLLAAGDVLIVRGSQSSGASLAYTARLSARLQRAS